MTRRHEALRLSCADPPPSGSEPARQILVRPARSRSMTARPEHIRSQRRVADQAGVRPIGAVRPILRASSSDAGPPIGTSGRRAGSARQVGTSVSPSGQPGRRDTLPRHSGDRSHRRGGRPSDRRSSFAFLTVGDRFDQPTVDGGEHRLSPQTRNPWSGPANPDVPAEATVVTQTSTRSRIRGRPGPAGPTTTGCPARHRSGGDRNPYHPAPGPARPGVESDEPGSRRDGGKAPVPFGDDCRNARRVHVQPPGGEHGKGHAVPPLLSGRPRAP